MEQRKRAEKQMFQARQRSLCCLVGRFDGKSTTSTRGIHSVTLLCRFGSEWDHWEAESSGLESVSVRMRIGRRGQFSPRLPLRPNPSQMHSARCTEPTCGVHDPLGGGRIGRGGQFSLTRTVESGVPLMLTRNHRQCLTTKAHMCP